MQVFIIVLIYQKNIITFFFEFDKIKIIYNDPRRFGYFKLLENKNKLENFVSNYGPEPFSSKFDSLKRYDGILLCLVCIVVGI